MSLFTLTCILRTRGGQTGTDRYGNPIYGPDVDTPSVAWWEIAAESESTDGSNQYVSQYLLYLPLSADLDGWDAVVLDTDTDGLGVVAQPDADEYQVIGRPGRQPGGFVVDGYYRLLIERVTG